MPTNRPGSSLLTALAVVAVLGLAGCQDDASSNSSSASSSRPSPTTQEDAAGPVEGADETDAVAFGKAVWQAFYGNSDLPKDQWWSALKPLLSPAAAGVHVYDDPRTFPTVTVTGDFAEADKAPYRPGVTAEVYVPSNEGRYSLFLIRSSETAPWRLEAIGFPKGAQ